MPLSIIKHNLLSLANRGLIKDIDGKAIETSRRQRLDLVLLALKEGADVERACKVLCWRDFEDLAALILSRNGFGIRKHFRFKTLGKRYEIDVIGLKEPLVLSVECKHWKRSWLRLATINVIKSQVHRTKALIKLLPDPKDRLDIAKWRGAKFMSLVLTLSDTPLKIYEGVPVIPVFYFNSFLNEIQTYINELTCFSIKETMKL